MKKLNKEERLDPPKATSSDSAHLLTKVVLSPILGAPELFEFFIAPPLQKRTQKWMEEVAEALRKIEKDQGVALEKLQSDERFITIMLQASTIAVRSHQREKLAALKNAILNSASGSDINEDLELIFVRFIEELMPIHLYLLKFFIDNENKLSLVQSYSEIHQLLISENKKVLSRDEFKMLIGELETRGLIWVSQDINDFEEIYQASTSLLEETNDDLPRVIVTDVAKKFMKYISYSLGA